MNDSGRLLIPLRSFDPIIGQGTTRQLSGTNPDDPTIELNLPVNWVVPRGGEYFFVPSVTGLREMITLPTP